MLLTKMTEVSAPQALGFKSIVTITAIMMIPVLAVFLMSWWAGSWSLIPFIPFVAYALIFAMLFFKTITWGTQSAEIRTFPKFYKAPKKLEFRTFNKVELSYCSYRHSIVILKISFRNGKTSKIGIALLEAEARLLQKTFESYGLTVVSTI